MIPRRCGIILPLVTIAAACAAGTTMRVSHNEDEGQGDEAVALAPAPEPSDSNPASAAPAESLSVDTVRSSAQGYGEYNNNPEVDFRRIGQWTRTGISESRRLVIRDANAWADFWSELGVGERPDIDFRQDVVAAVAAGQRASGGYEIAVERVRRNGGELEVEVVETAPGPNCMTTSALTQPVDVVVIPGVAPRSWSFVERKEVRGCR